MTKYILSVTKLSYLLMALCGGIFLSSCDKDESSGIRTSDTPPTIERVRLTDPATKDSSLKQSTLGSTIAIVGTNLASATTVSFNNYKLNVNPAYATDNVLIITIHDSVPTIATNPNVPDEIKVVTPGGEATYKFTVLPPRPEITQIGNEFAKAGETVTIYGRYFYFVDSVFIGTRAITTGITTNGTSLTVTIPAGTDLTQGDLRIRSKSGISATGPKTKFYNPARSMMLIDWDGIQKFGWGLNTATAVKTSYPGITPIDGKFVVIEQTVPGNWGWNNDKVIHMQDWSDNNKLFSPLPAGFDSTAPISNYEIKMEMASTLPVGDLMLQAWQQNPAAGNIEKNVSLKDFVKSADGKWYTVAVNLADVVSSTAKLSTYRDLYNRTTGESEFRLVLINSTPAGIPTKLAIDNIRVEKVR